MYVIYFHYNKWGDSLTATTNKAVITDTATVSTSE